MDDPAKKFPNLVRDAKDARRIIWRRKGSSGIYDFHVFSVGERGTGLSAGLVSEVKKGLLEQLKPYAPICDKLLTIVPGGNQWALLLADAAQLPLTIIRDGTSGWPDEVVVDHQNKLYKRKLFLRNNMRGKRVVVIDDVMSSGSTMNFLLTHLRDLGVEVLAVLVVIIKGTAYRNIADKHKVPVHGLLQVDESGVRLPD